MLDTGLFIALIVALGQALKIMTPISKRYLPAINIVLGIVFGVLFFTDDLKTNILTGLMIGLSSSGLFDTSKIFKPKQVEQTEEVEG